MIDLDAVPDIDADEYNGQPGSKFRFAAYQQIVRVLFGRLGRNARVRHPPCIVNEIRQLAPSDNGQYTGFRPPAAAAGGPAAAAGGVDEDDVEQVHDGGEKHDEGGELHDHKRRRNE